MPLITDGGDHPPQTLAMHCAEALIPPEAGRGHELEAARLRIELAEVLGVHLEAVRASPHDPQAPGHQGLAASLAARALADARAAAAGGRFAPWFGPDGEARALSVLAGHLNTCALNARGWRA